MKLGILYSSWRRDEELLAAAAEKRGWQVRRIDEARAVMPLAAMGGEPLELPDIVLERCREHARALAALAWFESRGVPTVNRLEVARICGNKVYSSAALGRAGVPTPATAIAFSVDGALQAAESIGYPVMLKPVVGDQGELVARVGGRDEARAILEHKRALALPAGAVFYVQRWVERPGRDLRVFVIGEEVVAAAWLISNRSAATEEQAIVAECPVTEEIRRVASAAARAVGGGVLGVDLLEAAEGLVVTELNYTIEFSRLGAALPADIPSRVLDYVAREAREGV